MPSPLQFTISNTITADYCKFTNVDNTNGTTVSATNSIDDGGNINITFISSQQIPLSPVLLLPVNNAKNINLNTVLSWNSSSGADTYRIQVSTVSGFDTTIFDISGVSDTSQEISGLTYGITYYWRVNATNTDGTSDWSTIRSFYCNPSITVYARYRGH
jgi:hypothetical protein